MLTALREELAGLEKDLVDEHEVAEALRQFDPVWEVLSPREKARAIQLLVERVAYNGVEGKVSVTFRPNGLRALAGRLSAKEA